MRTVGPKYGKLLGQIKNVLATLDGNAAMDELNEKGALTFTVADTEVVLTKDDLLIDSAQIPGYVSESDQKMTVVLDTNLTPELVEEGFVREIVSKVQTMRKEAGFEVMDKIRLTLTGSDKLVEIFKNNADSIKNDVLAEEILVGTGDGYEKDWTINGESATISVKKFS
jgi:isoleucyl-tRNA synthetase